MKVNISFSFILVKPQFAYTSHKINQKRENRNNGNDEKDDVSPINPLVNETWLIV